MDYTILTTSNSRNAGGLCGAIAGITREANKLARTIDLISYDDLYTKDDWWQYGKTINHPYTVSSLPLLSSFGYSSNLMKTLEDVSPLLIDVQGLWMYASWAALKYQKAHPKSKKVITPHGMLDSWAVKNSIRKKMIVGHIFEYENLRTADCFHALCRSEYESIREFGLKQPVAIIPNGIELPHNLKYNRNKEQKILLYISRIHPKKAIKEMIEGVSLLKNKFPNLLAKWKIKIAGWDQLNHQEELQRLAVERGVDDNIVFIGPVFGDTKEKELCQADAFILPSFSEGLPMSILEAWSYKLPCIMTDYCNLPEGFEYNAAIRVIPNPESIMQGLTTLMMLSDEKRNYMGENGYNLCKESFTWKSVAEKKLEMYNWLIGICDKPSFVITD